MFKKMIPFLFLLAVTPLFAQTPPGGKPLFNKPGIDLLPLGEQPADKPEKRGKSEKIKVEGQTFQEALRLTTYLVTKNKWDVQVDTKVPVATQKGEVLLAEFWMRAVQAKGEAGEAKSEIVFERIGDPWTKAIEYSFSVGPQWKKFSLPFAAVEDLGPEKAHISFRMGYGPQVMDLADLKVTTYGDKKTVADLPQTKAGYGGMEADASWRKEAADRIEKLRKGDLTVSVADRGGKPVPGAKVSVKMKRHAFYFGSAVAAQNLSVPGTENDRYRKEVERLFNLVVFENDLKWQFWEEGASNTGYWRRQYVDDSLKWLKERRIDLRGHNLVWGGWDKNNPARVRALKGDKTALERAIEEHIAEVAGAMAGKVVDWDVNNEPVPEHEFTDLLGKERMIDWFKAAKKADPKACLFLNDYPNPDAAGYLDDYEKDVKFLLDNKAPLEGIGIQGHVGGSPWSIPSLLQVLDRFGIYGLPIEITEFDTGIKDEELNAQFLRDFMTAVFSHPSSRAFVMWNFWDGAHSDHRPQIFNQDWTERASGKAYEDLVFHDWWTNADGATDEAGSYQTRGFLGDYEITVTSGSKKAVLAAKLGKDGLNLPVVLK